METLRKASESAVAPRTIPCQDPATLEPLGEVPALGRDEVLERVARARAVQPAWGEASFSERRRVLRRLLAAVIEQADDLCSAIVRDAGKTRENAMLGEIWPVCEKLRWTIANGERALRPQRVSPGLMLHKSARIEYHPLGVIGVICPWNFPLQNVLGPTIPALMAGNAVVVKVSEWTAWSAARFQALLDGVLRETGHPTDLVQIITGYGDAGAALVSSGADKIVFTGSMATGRRIIEESAKTLVPVVLELGGKDPLIVCDDADLEEAVHGALDGVFLCSGQMCLAAERVYVHHGIYDRFVSDVVARVQALRQGAPGRDAGRVDVGAMTMPGQVDIVERLVDDAVRKGARVLAGGRRGSGGQFFEPTVLTEVTHEMAIMREETFGPVMCVARVQSDDEAVRLANDTVYGLGSSVFTRDGQRARRIAAQLRAGNTSVNGYGLTYMAQALPFGGIKGSGFGRLNGVEGLRACTNVKSALYDRLPIPVPGKVFPITPTDYGTTRGVIRLVYGSGIKARLLGALDLLRHLPGRATR